MPIRWTSSADKHGISQEEVLYAMTHWHYYLPEFDEPRVGGRRPDLYIGPTRLGGPLLEVMVTRIPPRDLEIFHVMPLRDKIRRRAEQANKEN